MRLYTIILSAALLTSSVTFSQISHYKKSNLDLIGYFENLHSELSGNNANYPSRIVDNFKKNNKPGNPAVEFNKRISKIEYDEIYYDSNFVIQIKPKIEEYTYSPLGNSKTIIKKIFKRNSWFPNSKIIYNFDLNGNVIEELNYYRKDNNWINWAKTINEHTIEGNLEVVLSSNYNRGELVGRSLDSSIYNKDGTRTYYSKSNYYDGKWRMIKRDLLKYDESSGLITFINNNYYSESERVTYTYIYDENGNTYESSKDENGGYGWRYIYSYDQAGNLVSILYTEQSKYIWSNTTRRLFEVNSNDNQVSKLLQYWIDDTWVNINKEYYTYNSSHQLASNTQYRYENGEWSPVRKNLFAYNNSGQVIEDIYQSPQIKSEEIIWHNYVRTIYAYNSNGLKIYEALEHFQGNSTWKTSTENIYDFTLDGKELSYKYKELLDGVLTLKVKRYSHFTQDGLLTEGASEIFENGWNPYNYFVNLNENSIPIGIHSEISKIKISYESFNELNYNSPEKTELFQNFPNPFNPSTEIYFSLSQTAHVKIEVYNSIGQRVKTLVNKVMGKGVHKVDFNASGLSSGIYFYSIQSGNSFDAKKMVVIK